jgi:flagellar motor component MotA
MLWMLALGVALGLALSRVITTRGKKHQGENRALLALQYELFTVVRDAGREALDAHASDWKTSPIFRRYPSISGDDVIRTYLVDALLLLADDANATDLDQLLSASLRIARKRRPARDKAEATRRNRMLESIRRSALAMRHGASPVSAVRSGRKLLDEKPSTQDITRAMVEITRPAAPPRPRN